ncbi:MAG: hypothetical protein H6822_10285 [Planctomycetaceae bacterium]|nr:hypothetical protein [Planctomycetaceae bacterium]
MATVSEPRSIRHTPKIASWMPLLVFPAVVLMLGADWPAWIFMWSLSFALYAGFKWLTFADCAVTLPTNWRTLSYLLLWPGMDATSFLDQDRSTSRARPIEWLNATLKLMLGVALIILSKSVISLHPLLGGWIGMTGIAFVLHFGLIHLLSNLWRESGIHAVPIMNAPVMASSLSDFWGRRWNLAFRDLAHAFVFRPFSGSFGVTGATMAVFVVSGVIHDVVISTAARAGYGLPTLYFIIQGLALLFERSRIGRRIGLGKTVIGWVYCAGVILGPVGLLFHRPFIEHVVVPMLRAL